MPAHEIDNGFCKHCGIAADRTNIAAITCTRRPAGGPRPIPPSMFKTLDGIDAIYARIKELREERERLKASPG